MTKEVFVTLKGLQVHEQVEPNMVEMMALGEYYEKNGKKYIIYEEAVEGFDAKIKNIIKVSPDTLEVTKRGNTNTHMIFQVDKKNITYYRTPFGEFQIGIFGKKINIQESDGEMDITVEYELEMNYEFVANCNIQLNVKSKGEGIFSLRD